MLRALLVIILILIVVGWIRHHDARSRLPIHAMPLRIVFTGPDNDAEVVILHSVADRIVPPSQLPIPERRTGPNLAAIVDDAKVLLFPLPNRETRTPLVAFPNQAATSTLDYDDGVFRSFGGLKPVPTPTTLTTCAPPW